MVAKTASVHASGVYGGAPAAFPAAAAEGDHDTTGCRHLLVVKTVGAHVAGHRHRQQHHVGVVAQVVHVSRDVHVDEVFITEGMAGLSIREFGAFRNGRDDGLGAGGGGHVAATGRHGGKPDMAFSWGV